MSEQMVVSKVEELMTTIDQVKRYRALARLLVDFAIIGMTSVVILLSIELVTNYWVTNNNLGCYFASAINFGCTSTVAVESVGSPSIGFAVLIVPLVAVLLGIYWTNAGFRAVKIGEWKGTLAAGFPGAMELIMGMDWDKVLADIRTSKIVYAIYGAVKLACYWILVSIVLLIPFATGSALIHAYLNVYLLAAVSLVLTLTISRRDIQKRYRQVASLDTLMWELRWFDSEFRSANFKT